MARALLFQANLPIKFWGECVLTAVHLINRTPSKVLQGKTPFEALYQRKPSYTHLRVFGTLCFAQNKRVRDKFTPRGRKCVFLGYPFGKKGWKLLDLETQEFFVSRDVIFHENLFPYALDFTVEPSFPPPQFSRSLPFDEPQSQISPSSYVRGSLGPELRPTTGPATTAEVSDQTSAAPSQPTALQPEQPAASP